MKTAALRTLPPPTEKEDPETVTAHQAPDATDPAAPGSAVDSLTGAPDAGLLLVCDHASNAIPAEYADLGLPRQELSRHIAYDIGAADVTRRLAKALHAPAILSTASRLLIDLNRGLDDPTLVMRLSDGAVVPGNRLLTEAERTRRIERFYNPYHGAIAATLDRLIDAATPPILLSIHSFTPVWRGTPRPWHAAVLWDRDRRLAGHLLDHLRRDAALVIGDNEPYTGRLEGDCMHQHGTRRGLAHAIVEIRQDLIAEAAGQEAWAERLGDIVRALLADHAIAADLRRTLPLSER